MGRREKKGWAPTEYSPCHSELTSPLAIRKLCFPVHLFPLPPLMHTLDLGLPAIQEGWPQQLPEGYQCRGCPCPGLNSLWRDYTPTSSTKHSQHPGKGLQPRKLEQVLPGCEKICLILRQSFRVGLHWGKATWVCSSPSSQSSPWGGAKLLWNSCTGTPAPCSRSCNAEELEEDWQGHEKICQHSRTVLLSQAALGKCLLGL